MTRARLLALVGAVAILTGSIAALQTRPSQAQMGPMAGPPLEQLTGDEFDKAFLMHMTMHHMMAVMMAQPLTTNAAHQELKDLGQAIINDQTREIAQMQAWLRDWYGITMPMGPGMMPGGQPGAGPMPGHMGHGAPGGQMPGMGPGGQMPGMGQEMGMMGGMFAALSGPRLEVSFMSLMIPHHEDAVTMARLALERAAHQELKNLAQDIIRSQSAEVTLMNTWLADWYGL